MAIEVKVLKVGSDVLTDLRPGRTRRTIYTPAGQLGPMMAFLLGVGAVGIAPGVIRYFAGSSPRAKAREALEDDLTAAKITGEMAKADLIRANIAQIAREFDPVSEEGRVLKLQAIRNALPLDLAAAELDLEQEREATARADQLFPLVLQEKEAALGIQQELRTERAERQVEFLQTERVKRELLAEETERRDLLNQQLEQQVDAFNAAIGPLDQAQAAQFFRERLFPKPAERPTPPRIFGATGAPFEFGPEGRITTIRGF